MYALINNQAVEKYPYTIGNLRKDNPNTSFPRNPGAQTLAEWHVLPVQPTQRPEYDMTKNITEGTPVYQDGAWVQVWHVTDATQEEIAERQQALVPQFVSRFQAKAALAGAGLLDTVEAMMSNSETPIVARLAWQDALEFRRDSPTILTMAASLELTPAQVDDLFIAAAQITA